MTFDQLKLIEPIMKALNATWYTIPTPIQAKSIPVILEGHDLFGCAQTGTGKTASFAIPTLQMLYNSKKAKGDNGKIKALILTPTRELAIQIGESFTTYGKFMDVTHTVIFGGVGQSPQVKAIRKGVDVVIATPGRLLDLINQKHVNLGNLEMFILDEADRMLDMGFINDIKKILTKLPNKRQSLFFSATMPAEILKLAHTILKNPLNVAVTPVSSTVKLVQQSLYYVDKADKRDLLVHLLKDTGIESALVFTRTKHGADKVTQVLAKAGIAASAIHGNKSQSARQNALQNLKSKKIRVLVATDIAARGIDINELSHVFIYDIPTEPETYVHRIGRTGRAGSTGVAIAFCDNDEKKYLKDIIRVINQDIPVVEDHPYKPTKNAGAEYRKPTPKNLADRRPRAPHSEIGRPQPRSQTSRSADRTPADRGGQRSYAPRTQSDRPTTTGRPRAEWRSTSTRSAWSSSEGRSYGSQNSQRFSSARPTSARTAPGPNSEARAQSRSHARSSEGHANARPAQKSYQKSFQKTGARPTERSSSRSSARPAAPRRAAGR